MYDVRPNAARAKAARICLAIMFVFIVIASFVTIWQYILLKNAASGASDSSALSLSDVLSRTFAGIRLSVFIVTAVFFIRWFRRAYYNLNQYRPTAASLGESSAASAWFIPFISLGRPFIIMREIWNGAQDALNINPAERPSVTLLGFWWLFWLLYNISGSIIYQMSRFATDISSYQLMLAGTLISDLFEIAALVLVLVIITKLSGIETLIERAEINGEAGIFGMHLDQGLNPYTAGDGGNLDQPRLY